MELQGKSIPRLIAFLFGMFAITGQVLILREWLGLSPDSELSVALGMAFFLLWLFAGNLLSARFLSGRPGSRAFLPVTLALAAFLLPAALFVVSCARPLMGLSPFATLSFARLLAFGALAFGPLGMALGLVFPLLLEGFGGRGKETGIYSVYMMESLGSGAGTLFLVLFVSPLLSSLSLSLALSSLLLAASLVHGAGLGGRPQGAHRLLAGGLLAVFVLSAFTGFADDLNRRIKWHEIPRVSARNSRYGPVEVVAIGNTKSVYVNSQLVYNDYYYDNLDYLYKIAKLKIHSVKRVLVLGEYANGWPPDDEAIDVDCIINDEVLSETIQGDLNGRKTARNAKVHVDDLHNYIIHTKNRYDLIVLAMDQPIRLSSNVYLSVPFFEHLRKILNRDGLLMLQVASTRRFISSQRMGFLACVRKSLAQVFPSVRAMPGHTAIFLAGNGAETAGEPLDEETRDYFYRMHDPERTEAFSRHLEEMGGAVAANDGFRPTAYFHDLLARLFAESNPLRHLMKDVFNMDRAWTYFLPLLILAVLYVSSRLFGSRLSLVLGMSSALGFFSFSLEIIVLFTFSVLHGELYHSLGIITGSFMLGLALGSSLFRARAPACPARSLSLALGLFALTSLALYSLLALGLATPLALYPLSGMAGVLTGVSFPLLVSLALRTGPGDPSLAGRVYAMDLLGASAAALLVGPVALAVLGVPGSCLWLALMATSGSLLLLLRKLG